MACPLIMKISFTFLLLFCIFFPFYSCRENCQSTFGLGIALKGFHGNENDFVLKKYLPGSGYTSPVDSIFIDSNTYFYTRYQNIVFTQNFPENLLMPGFEYEIDFIHLNISHRISDLTEYQATNPYFDKVGCTNPIMKLRLDGTWVKRGLSADSFLYFYK